ncbi:hypothetical protein SAMN05428642_101390 [Flaviramulus basaltis]|uniref:Uncharacterized protein n=1 Tax=Flaviramulus basaltis TaxID=369401 RepID=A0A1K2IAZ0_9FLAO|nr:hypothetical protein [Flaviramulus basaltis]SFZ89553.1 hypothetical protein SAMN05428642_101390 [Flaviramulus basaltis]
MENLKVVQFDFGFECEPIAAKEKVVQPTKTDKSDFVFDFMDCLASPIIVFKSAWQDTIPRDILGRIKLSRIICSMSKEKMASLTETLAYIMPRTYEAPMPTEWVNIYTWLGLQYAKQFKKEEQLKAMAEIAPKELSGYEKGLLKNLRLWIYEKRRKALKDILKKDRISKEDGILDIQEKLF